MKLIIDRNKWLRGEGNENSKLLRKSDGKMCCLGFHALACGLKEDEILDVSDPYSCKEFYPKNSWTISLDHVDGIDINYLIRINDTGDMDEKLREIEISETFAKHDVEVEFIN